MFRLRAVYLSQQQVCRLVVLLLTLGLAASAAAQGERGVIGGTVADAQGGVLPGATVTARVVFAFVEVRSYFASDSKTGVEASVRVIAGECKVPIGIKHS